MFYFSFHLVNRSPWPIICSFNALSFISSLILFFYSKNFFFLNLVFFNLILSSFQWWRDVTREASLLGDHTKPVLNNIKIGFFLFIISEIFFFLRFFWRFFHIILAPDIEIGLQWPPIYILSFNPYHIPLLNTLILLSRGFSVTWCHHCIINRNFKEAKKRLSLTILIGFYFTLLQIFEYFNAFFSISDSVFGSVFFITTGFHGLHVIIGSLFLFYNLIRLNLFQFNKKHHFRFEASAWYWHFVDIIWLFLFSFIYWWIF